MSKRTHKKIYLKNTSGVSRIREALFKRAEGEQSKGQIQETQQEQKKVGTRLVAKVVCVGGLNTGYTSNPAAAGREARCAKQPRREERIPLCILRKKGSHNKTNRSRGNLNGRVANAGKQARGQQLREGTTT